MRSGGPISYTQMKIGPAMGVVVGAGPTLSHLRASGRSTLEQKRVSSFDAEQKSCACFVRLGLVYTSAIKQMSNNVNLKDILSILNIQNYFSFFASGIVKYI